MNKEEPKQSSAEPEEESIALRGRELGSERMDAVNHLGHAQKRNPDVELRLDGEKDSLYSDGLDLDDGSDPLAGTHGFNSSGDSG